MCTSGRENGKGRRLEQRRQSAGPIGSHALGPKAGISLLQADRDEFRAIGLQAHVEPCMGLDCRWRSGSRHPGQQRKHERDSAGQCSQGIARQSYEHDRSQPSGRQWLAGLHRNPQHDQVAADIAQGLTDVVLVGHRNPCGGQDQTRVKGCTPEGAAHRGPIILANWQRVDDRAAGAQQRRQHRQVGVMDLARRETLARASKLPPA